MKTHRSRAPYVLAAAAVILALAGSLAARLPARDTARSRPVVADTPAPPPGPARVPAPSDAGASMPDVPCWSCPDADSWPIRFRTDLDLLAPLGDGSENAALWFKDFAKPAGSRAGEADAASKRYVAADKDLGRVLPPADPLLLEAEPWVDQATMRFYPDVFPIAGYETPIPNLQLALTFAKSWVARGRASADPARAAEDFRRAVRLGRLLRQEDATLIADLVGLACIRHGLLAIYEAARRDGDSGLALTAAVALGEIAPQRLRSAELVTRADVMAFVGKGIFGMGLKLPEKRLGDLETMALGAADRRFRGEATLSLGVVRLTGSSSQKERASAVLDKVAASDDQVLSALATWARDEMRARELVTGD